MPSTIHALPHGTLRPESNQREVTVDAHNVWWKSDINPAFEPAGFTLEGPAPRAMATIEKLIDEYSLHRQTSKPRARPAPSNSVNIYALSRDPREAACYHVDRHVVKMIVESAQILCTVLHDTGVEAPYRPTHRHHPAVRWAGTSRSNWRWLRELALALNDEYRYRYQRARDHRSAGVIRSLPEPDIPERGMTPFAQVVPAEYRRDDAVEAYRAFYRGAKSHLARWTRRPVPEWWEHASETRDGEPTDRVS